ncbi:MAG: peptide methionine sulfoxide reductase msrA/msrB [Candidatus Saccharimonadales bacterium]|jgi:peptide methionine sulfoxide reductase msrA/msrB
MTRNRIIVTIVTLLCIVTLYLSLNSSGTDTIESMQTVQPSSITTPVTVPEGQEVATLAGGCFWCVEAVFQETAGVEAVISGYAGGQEQNPTYEAVYTGSTGHKEAIQVFYNPSEITFSEILDVFWRSIDPTDDGGQFVDRGQPYTTAVYYHDSSQKVLAESSIVMLDQAETLEAPVVTPIIAFTTFYPAEDYHQDYYIKAPTRYKQYEENSGREEYREQIWQEIMQTEI